MCNIKHTYEYVKGRIEKEGYKLLSKEYKGVHEKLELECPKGHKFKMTICHFKKGQRCSTCAGNKKLTYEHVKGKIEKEGYKLLSEEYKNAHIKLKLECLEGHNFLMKWNDLQQGHGCPKCYGNKKLEYKYVKEEIEKEGYKLLSKEYKNNYTKLKLECSEGHIYKMSFSCFKQGQRCPTCFYKNGSSKGEKEVLEYIQSLTTDTIIPNDRSQIINPKTGQYLELDIYLPNLRKAIEYNGTYWHSDDEVIYKDEQKVLQCKELGIDLLVINEEEWINNKDEQNKKIKKFIKNFQKGI